MRYAAIEEMPWQLRVITGIVSILFGVVAIAWPGITVGALLFLFGIYAFVFGIVRLVATVRAIGAHETWWTHLIIGILSIIAGILVFAVPGWTMVFLTYMIAWWAIIVGIFEIVAAFTASNWILILTGGISILFGLVLLAYPVRGLFTLVVIIGIFSIIRGVMDLVSGIRAPSQTQAHV